MKETDVWLHLGMSSISGYRFVAVFEHKKTKVCDFHAQLKLHESTGCSWFLWAGGKGNGLDCIGSVWTCKRAQWRSSASGRVCMFSGRTPWLGWSQGSSGGSVGVKLVSELEEWGSWLDALQFDTSSVSGCVLSVRAPSAVLEM